MIYIRQFALIFFLFLPQLLYSQASNIGADGKTFSQRRSDWLGNLPACSKTSMTEGDRRDWIWGWLINGTEDFSRGSCTDDTIEEMLAWGKGTQAQKGILAYIAWEYGDNGNNLIANQTETNIKNWYKNHQIGNAAVYQSIHPQKRIIANVGVLLYLIRWDTGGNLDIPRYGCPTWFSDCSHLADNWPSFTFNGNSYTFADGPYNATTLTRDWIEWKFASSYLPASQREFHGANYSRQFMTSMMLLWAGTPTNNPIHKKAQMIADLLALDQIADTGNQLSQVGVRGRSQFDPWVKNARSTLAPQYIMFGFSTQQYRLDCQGMWDYQYPVPNVIIDLGVWTDRSDDDWLYTETFNENDIIHKPDRGKWTFQKKHWGLGSSDGNRGAGWSLVAREGDGTNNSNQMIFWINNETQADLEEFPGNLGPQGSYLGDNGRQFHGSLLADISQTNYLHLYKTSSFNWDDGPTVIGNWTFYRNGEFAFAYQQLANDACLEAITIGDEYASYAAFKTGIAGASCVNNRYTDSKGKQIDDNDYVGLTSPGDRSFPFDRLYMKDNDGNEIVTWDYSGGTLGVMRVEYKGDVLVYDYDEWFTSEDTTPPKQCGDGIDNDADTLIDWPADPGCTGVDDDSESPDPPLPPSGVIGRRRHRSY